MKVLLDVSTTVVCKKRLLRLIQEGRIEIAGLGHSAVLAVSVSGSSSSVLHHFNECW